MITNKLTFTYEDSGVNIKEGENAVDQMKKYVSKTFSKNVLTSLGGFGGLFQLDLNNIKNPVLVSGTDGVGTKLKIAFMMDKHDTVGIDLVAMCVNDILCSGASPLFFLDYIATGRLKAEKIATIVKGISDGCQMAKCSLIGGETAEMPGFYPDNEYDLAGFAVGIVDKEKIVDGLKIQNGDVLVGIQSSGVHSNGYSLIRKIFFEHLGLSTDTYLESVKSTVGDLLLAPTKIYVEPVLHVLKLFDIKGMCHITGGGFIENIPRIIPSGLGVKIQMNSWEELPIFSFINDLGLVDAKELYKTFNMGIGFILIVDKNDSILLINELKRLGEKAFEIGVVSNELEGVSLCQS